LKNGHTLPAGHIYGILKLLLGLYYPGGLYLHVNCLLSADYVPGVHIWFWSLPIRQKLPAGHSISYESLLLPSEIPAHINPWTHDVHILVPFKSS